MVRQIADAVLAVTPPWFLPQARGVFALYDHVHMHMRPASRPIWHFTHFLGLLRTLLAPLTIWPALLSSSPLVHLI